MNLILPKNIFTDILGSTLKNSYQKDYTLKPSALLSKDLTDKDIALIPALDIIQHKELFVSSKRGISFEGTLSNSYIYFSKTENVLKNIILSGDVSAVEAILTKIVFSELYEQEVSISLTNNSKENINQNMLLIGDANFESNNFLSGIPLTDEVNELTNLPFVNFIFASKNKELLKQFEEETADIEKQVYASIENSTWDCPYSDEVKTLFQENYTNLIYEFDSSDVSAMDELLRLTFYHGIIKEIFEIKYT